MRLGIINGNGCVCNVCKAMLEPDEAIKVIARKLSDNPKKAATGCYKTIGRMDLCEDCYKKLLVQYIEQPRGKEKN